MPNTLVNYIATDLISAKNFVEAVGTELKIYAKSFFRQDDEVAAIEMRISAHEKLLSALPSDYNERKAKLTKTGAALTTITALLFPWQTALLVGTSFLGGAIVSGQANTYTKKHLVSLIKSNNIEMIKKKIETIQNATGRLETDFVFNRKTTTPLSEKYQVYPVQMEEEWCIELIGMFDSKKSSTLTLTTIDISDASMADEHLLGLLGVGMGRYSTAKLVLSNNELTDKSIGNLKKFIVKKKEFQQLKHLDVSGNKLTSACLNDIVAIVNALDIEELNLSNNFELGDSLGDDHTSQLESFIKQIRTKMPSLRRLYLKNVNLIPQQVSAFATELKGLSMLEILDISENPAIEARHIVRKIENKGLKFNLSLTELTTDYDRVLRSVHEALKAHIDAFATFEHTKECAKLVSLMNYKLTKKPLPESITKFITESALNVEIEQKISAIVNARTAAQRNPSSEMTMTEFYHLQKGTLTQFYTSENKRKTQQTQLTSSATIVDKKQSQTGIKSGI